MRKAILAIALLLIGATGAQAGALFDDYLNYVRPGTGTGPGKAQVTAMASQSVGQSFTLPANTGEVYRIGVRPVYDTWAPGEIVTMTLYDSPAKQTKLGEYQIDEATCHVDDYKIGDGSDPRTSARDLVLYFQFRKLTEGKDKLYFELSVSGAGDKKVAFFAFDTDAYAGGECYPAGAAKDIAFECHIKPAADKQANLRKFFTERLDTSLPELAAVKAAADAGDYEKAIAETVKHFRNRKEVWFQSDGSYAAFANVAVDPAADTTTADTLMKGMVFHAKTKQPIPWRKESWWTAVIPGADQPNHGTDPSPFLWHFDRNLAGAYTVTGKPEYAAKSIELRMQFILDNPNPKVVYEGAAEFPWYFEIWNDRTAGARAPGHAELVYARLYNYPGWTNDQQLVYFSFLEDNARWDYKATSGGNWGVEAARSALDFGDKFTEWKMSSAYKNWGAARMIELSGETVRPEGVSTEAAVKYHAMVARRFLGLLEMEVDGRIKLDPASHEQMLKQVNGMYDHMAYVEQPDNYVVMCGDSWYENHAEEPGLSVSRGDGRSIPNRIKDPKSLALKLRDGSDPVSKSLAGRFSADSLALLQAYDGKSEPSITLQRAIVEQINAALKSGSIYDERLFAGVKLRDRTKRMLAMNPREDDLQLLNKWLIEDAYPSEISKSYYYGELYKAATLLNRQDIAYIASQGEAGTRPTEISKIYPEAGYYIMRSDFGGPGLNYTDSRQMFIHNGGWSGSHGHWDLTAINLYGYGRTLIIDPGQYSYVPPAGYDTYWKSSIHSMMVPDDRDAEREPGPSRWTANSGIDYFDGQHFGFNKIGDTDYVRRRVGFVKPDYFLVDDSAKTKKNADWAQCWNLTDPNARYSELTGAIDTSFAQGGNVMILNQDPTFAVRKAPGMTGAAKYKDTAVFRLSRKTDNPRFASLVYPYEAGARPKVDWERMNPDDASLGDLFYGVRVTANGGIDWAAFGECGKPASYRGGKHKADADFAVVRLDKTGAPKSFAWSSGRELVFGGKTLARADRRMVSLSVRYEGAKLIIEAKDPDASLAIAMARAKSVALNGKPVAKPVIKNGVCYPFGNVPKDIVADDRDAWELVKMSKYTKLIADPGAFDNQYTYDETDVGAREEGNFVFQVPEERTYRVEVYLPKITTYPTDRAEYRVNAWGKPVEAGGAIVSVAKEGDTSVFTVNQQAMSGWVTLGDFVLRKGTFRLNAVNVTKIDGTYFVADAARLVEQ